LEELAGGNVGNNVTTAAAGTMISTANILTARSNMGQWGHNPSDLVLFLSQQAYYGLMDNTNVVTVDKYGESATIRSGELGKVFGVSMVVSDAFEAEAAGKAQGILVNPQNYILGNYRALTVQSAEDIVAQQKAIVATRRFGFIAKEAGAAGKASMCLLKSGA